jgi:hypothetical protein
MFETADDLARLQDLIDSSHRRGGEHLRSVITGERLVTASELVDRLSGMCLLSLATTSRDGRPFVSPVDAFFVQGRFWFGSAPNALKMRHIARRPHVSATHLDGEQFAVSVHGTAIIEGTVAELADSPFGRAAQNFYGDGWLEWGDGAVYAVIEPDRLLVFHLDQPPEDPAGGPDH